ncbi:MAG: ATP-binding cassette domain-containing protein, partial [Candidatus Nanopelagicales bacterium]
MITAQALELRAGARLLLAEGSVRVGPGDRIGLVGRNGAGKTTLTKVLAGEAIPAAGTVSRSGTVGYLPQDPRTGDLHVTARDRILGARDLAESAGRMRIASERMGSGDDQAQAKAMRAYDAALAEFESRGGYAADSVAAGRAACGGLPARARPHAPLRLSGGQRRRVELARILFGGYDVLLLDEPTNHLDADSINWLRRFLASYPGGFVVISHDVGLLDATVNQVLHLDANRAEIDAYSMGWSAYLQQREVDERRRKRERAN